MKQVLEHVMEAYDAINDINEAELKWITDVTTQKHRSKVSYCEVCGSRHCVIEQHHVAGRKHDTRTISVCQQCHRQLSDMQNLYDRAWLNKQEDQNEIWLTRGLIDVFTLKYEKTHIQLYKEAANLITRGFRYDQ